MWVHRLTDIDPKTKTGTCANCGRVSLKHRVRDGKDKWRCMVAHRGEIDKYRQAHPQKQTYTTEQHRARRLKQVHGMSVDEYKAMYKRQRGRCAICKKRPKKGKRLYVDHCHATGERRKLLCQLCNSGLGFFLDDPALLIAAAKYLGTENPSDQSG